MYQIDDDKMYIGTDFFYQCACRSMLFIIVHRTLHEHIKTNQFDPCIVTLWFYSYTIIV